MTNDSCSSHPESLPVDVLDLTTDELRKKFESEKIEPYRAGQIHQWIFEKGVYDFDRMTNLSVPLREQLKKSFYVGLPRAVEKQRSAGDKSAKLLIRLKKGDFVETVYISEQSRRTICVSSQVGCKFHCAFCASGQNGFLRNLSMGEMLSQVLLARDLAEDKKITNIVFMGIGEPFDNYRQLLRTIRQLNAKGSLGIGARKITVSTCGVIPKIEALADEGLQVELSVSLHGPNDAVRGALMPVNKAFPVKPLIEACKKYVKKTKRAITFEYILVKGVNASVKEAAALGRLLKGMLCKVNLIPYNSIEEFPHEAPSYPEIVAFQQTLQSHGIKTTVRFSKGADIQAACGQLRSVHLKK
jgi:23S rRNA (adenine2503-C2)-methyltransferase